MKANDKIYGTSMRVHCYLLLHIFVVLIISILLLEFPFERPAYAQSLAGHNIIDHHCTDISKIPLEWIEKAQANLHIAYQHASHGRQIIEGMKQLDTFLGADNRYGFSTDGIDRGPAVLDITDGYDHPGTWWYPDVKADRITDSDNWVMLTRLFLDDPKHAHINVVMWSWCNITHYPNDIRESAVAYDVERYYIPYMERLISEYGPGGSKILSGERSTPVTFVYMTGHSNWGGDGRNRETFLANKKIRQHCIANNRVLYDFYDIECYNPDGEYFGDGEADRLDYGDYQEGCGNGIHNLNADTSYVEDPCIIWENRRSWGVEWQNRHTAGVDYYVCDCPHCDEAPILANLKAYAMWWMVAHLAGWNRAPVTVTINTTSSIPVISTTTSTIDNKSCLAEMIYGENSRQIELLRYVRDKLLIQTPEGQELIRLYYMWNNQIKQMIDADSDFWDLLKDLIDGFLELIVAKSNHYLLLKD